MTEAGGVSSLVWCQETQGRRHGPAMMGEGRLGQSCWVSSGRGCSPVRSGVGVHSAEGVTSPIGSRGSTWGAAVCSRAGILLGSSSVSGCLWLRWGVAGAGVSRHLVPTALLLLPCRWEQPGLSTQGLSIHGLSTHKARVRNHLCYAGGR